MLFDSSVFLFSVAKKGRACCLAFMVQWLLVIGASTNYSQKEKFSLRSGSFFLTIYPLCTFIESSVMNHHLGLLIPFFFCCSGKNYPTPPQNRLNLGLVFGKTFERGIVFGLHSLFVRAPRFSSNFSRIIECLNFIIAIPRRNFLCSSSVHLPDVVCRLLDPSIFISQTVLKYNQFQYASDPYLLILEKYKSPLQHQSTLFFIKFFEQLQEKEAYRFQRNCCFFYFVFSQQEIKYSDQIAFTMKSCSKERKVTKKRTLRQYLNQYTQLRRVRSAGCLSPPHSPIKKPSDPLSIFKDRTQQIIKIIEGFIKQKDVLGKVQEKLSSLVTLFQTNFEKKQNNQARNAQKQKEIEVINQQYLLNIPQEPEVELIKSFEKSKQTSQTIQTSGSRKIQRKFAQDSLDLALVSSTPSQAIIGKSLNQNNLAPPTKMSPILQKSLDFQLEDEPKIQQKRKKIYRKISSNIRLPTIPRLGSELNL